MIYLICGDDNSAVREKLHELLDVLSLKRPNAEIFRMTSEDWSEPKFSELIESQGLFENKYIVVLDTLLGEKNISAAVLERLDELKESENVFIFVQSEIESALREKIKKFAERVWWEDGEEIKVKKDFNVFALTDAFGRRDKKSLWVIYNKALLAGMEPEELHGLLFWQIKSLLVAAGAKNAEDAGQKPFVWSKAQGFLKNFSRDELARISSSLVGIYHNARRGIVDFDVALERFI